MALLASTAPYGMIAAIHGRAKRGLATLDEKAPNHVVLMTVA